MTVIIPDNSNYLEFSCQTRMVPVAAGGGGDAPGRCGGRGGQQVRCVVEVQVDQGDAVRGRGPGPAGRAGAADISRAWLLHNCGVLAVQVDRPVWVRGRGAGRCGCGGGRPGRAMLRMRSRWPTRGGIQFRRTYGINCGAVHMGFPHMCGRLLAMHRMPVGAQPVAVAVQVKPPSVRWRWRCAQKYDFRPFDRSPAVTFSVTLRRR